MCAFNITKCENVGTRRVMTDDCDHDIDAINELVDSYFLDEICDVEDYDDCSKVPWHEPLFECHHK